MTSLANIRSAINIDIQQVPSFYWMRITNDSQPSVQLVLQVVMHPIPNHDSLDSWGCFIREWITFRDSSYWFQRPVILAVSPLAEVGELEDSMGINGETWGP